METISNDYYKTKKDHYKSGLFNFSILNSNYSITSFFVTDFPSEVNFTK